MVPVKAKKKVWLVYLLACADATFYCGITNGLEKRLKAHNTGTASKYTRSRLPVKLKAKSRLMTRSNALKSEYRIKQLPRSEKTKAVKTL